MKQFLLISLFSFMFFSCGEEEVYFTMPEEDLIKVLYDIQVAEAAIQTVHSDLKDSVVNIYYEQIYELHGIDKNILMKNIEAIKKNPEQGHKIYKQLSEYHKEQREKKK